MRRSKSGDGRIVMVPAPFQGHITPMLQLANIFHSKGFSITIVHLHLNSPDPFHHPNFQFLQLPPHNQTATVHELVALFLEINEACGPDFLDCLIRLRSNGEKIRCVVYDELMYFSESVASDLEIPSVILRTTSAFTYLARDALHKLKAEGFIPFHDSNSDKLVSRLEPLRFKDLPFPSTGTLENMLKLIAKTNETRSSIAVILNTMSCLEEEGLFAKIETRSQVPIFPIGPFHKLAPSSSPTSLLEEDLSCIQWLDKEAKHSVLYVSFGSVASVDCKELMEMAWGLANSEQRFLWVIRAGLVSGMTKLADVLPEGFHEAVVGRGYLVKWAPQKEVLAHPAVGGFLTHCGWNSTLESVAQGIPMICRPCFGDQKVNSRYLTHVCKVGFELEMGFDRSEIESTIRTLMVGERGKEMKERAVDLKNKVEQCTAVNGSSYSKLNELVSLLMSP